MVDCFILFCSSSLRWPIPVNPNNHAFDTNNLSRTPRHLISTSESSSKLGWFDLHFSHIVPLIWKSRPHFPSMQCQLLWSLKAGKLLACCLLLHQAGGYEGCWVTAPFLSISPQPAGISICISGQTMKVDHPQQVDVVRMTVWRCPENRRNSSPSYFEAFTNGSSNDVKPWLRDCKLTFILFFRIVDYIITYPLLFVHRMTWPDMTRPWLLLVYSICSHWSASQLLPFNNPCLVCKPLFQIHFIGDISTLLGNHTDCLPKSPQRLFNFPHGLHQVVRAHRLVRQGQGQPGVVETCGDMIFVQCCPNLRCCNLQHPTALR